MKRVEMDSSLAILGVGSRNGNHTCRRLHVVATFAYAGSQITQKLVSFDGCAVLEPSNIATAAILAALQCTVHHTGQ